MAVLWLSARAHHDRSILVHWMAGRFARLSVRREPEFFVPDRVSRWALCSEHPWLYVKPEGSDTPDQGWKLHVSGAALSAKHILHRVLPVLMAEPAELKLAGDLVALEWVCSNVCPREMAGKFITMPVPEGEAEST